MPKAIFANEQNGFFIYSPLSASLLLPSAFDVFHDHWDQ